MTSQSAGSGRGRATLTMAVVQLVVLIAVLLYAARLPLDPDRGLQQLDALTLRERVPGVDAIAGRPTLYVATGPLSAPHCRLMLRHLLAHRGHADGLSGEYGVVLLLPVPAGGPALAAAPGVVVRPDPDGATAGALALSRAARACQPGYAIVDRAGMVRYRTYDPDYALHPQEQAILLDATAANQ